MLSYLLRNKRWPIGLDVGTDSIKMLQMQRVGGSLGVCACARWRFPPSTPDASAERRAVAASAIHQILRCGNFRGRSVNSVLSGDQLAIRNVRLPQMPDHELKEALLWEAKERFDFDVTPDRLYYLNAGELRQGAETSQEIILMAARAEVVEDHLKLLEEAGLRPEHVEAEPVALFRIFERFLRRQADEEAVTVVVDIGLSSTRVVVARGRRILFVKSINIAGRRFNDAVAKQLNLSAEEAAELRTRLMREAESQPVGQGPDGGGEPRRDSINWSVHDALRAEAEALAREIALCLRYCLVTFRGIRSKTVTVTGGQAYDPALIELLGRNLNLDCVAGRPLRYVDVSAVDLGADRRGMMSEWAVCAGLAIRDIDVQSELQGSQHGDARLSA